MRGGVRAELGSHAPSLVAMGRFGFCLAVGLGSPIELGYRQSVTPDRLQGRMNAKIRSLNRVMITIGAPPGGWPASQLDYRPVRWIGIAGVTTAALTPALPPFRHANFDDSCEQSAIR